MPRCAILCSHVGPEIGGADTEIGPMHAIADMSRLEPTWERLAETVAAFDHQESHASLKVGIGKVDVPGNMEVGTTQGIRAFPTMRLFKKGEAVADYREDRTVEALLNWLKQKVDFEARTREWEKSHGAQFHGDVEEHPGCMLSGFVLVRVCQPTC